MLRFLGSASVVRRLAGAFGGVLLLASAGCTATDRSSWGQYQGWLRGCNPCTGMRENPWPEYAAVIRGENPCPNCADPCGSPCASPCPNPCPKPCEPCAPPPAPCAPPCASPASAGGPAGLPAEAKPGEAWCRVHVPAVYETVTERVQTHCPTTNCVWVPPKFETTFREVCVSGPCVRESEIPGVTKTESVCCEVEPARSFSRPRCCTCEERAAGKCRCCETVAVPAKRVERLHEVCVTPPSRRVVYEPAVYTTEPCQREVCPGRWEQVEVPAVYQTVTRQVVKVPERWEWRRNTACSVPTPTPPAPCAK